MQSEITIDEETLEMKMDLPITIKDYEVNETEDSLIFSFDFSRVELS